LDRRKHFRASVREVAELANVDKMTAKRSLHRITDAGFVVWAGSDDKSGGNLYTFGGAVAGA